MNPFKDDSGWFSSPLFFLAEKHAITITRLFDDLRKSNPSMNWFSPWTIGSVIRAGYIHFVALRRIRDLGNSEDMLSSLQMEISSCLESCEAMASRWPHVKKAYDVFKRLVVDNVAPTKEEVAEVNDCGDVGVIEEGVLGLEVASLEEPGLGVELNLEMDNYLQL